MRVPAGVRRLLLLALVSLVPAACGGGTVAEVPRSPCRAEPLGGETGLPASFPRPDEFVVTGSKRQGPTQVVDGFWEAGLEDAYREFREAVEAAGYDVTFDEIEAHDAEVGYAGSGRSGQIALRDHCTEDGVTLVRITNRPE